MNDKLIINLVPGDTFLHKLSGASKTRMFAVLIVVGIMTFDIRILGPLFVAGLIGLLSVKPDNLSAEPIMKPRERSMVWL